MTRKIPLEDRFWPRVLKTDTCWIWQGARVYAGHGQIKSADGKTNVLTHRLAWELLRGSIPEGKHLLHSCDNPPCVNPDHLRVGTSAENAKDWRARGKGIVAPRVQALRKGRPPEERFWENVSKTDTCWIWTGQKNTNGYGRVGMSDATSMLAHRFSWMLANGHPEKHHVLHHCDNPPCVNPAHLFLGNSSINDADKVSKGRQSRGTMLSTAILNEEQVREIRKRYELRDKRKRRNYLGDQDPNGAPAIAADYGVSQWTVFDVVRRRRWKHIE